MGLDYNMNTRDGETATFNWILPELPVDTTSMLFQCTASVEPITSDNKKTRYQFLLDVLEAAEKVVEEDQYCPPSTTRSVEQ
jgi:hypothetical protein